MSNKPCPPSCTDRYSIADLNLCCPDQKKFTSILWIYSTRALVAMITTTSVQRDAWMWERTQDWWHHVVGTFDEEQWVSNFRMWRKIFDML